MSARPRLGLRITKIRDAENTDIVIPAKAEIHFFGPTWIPAFAGMTIERLQEPALVFAFAGMTTERLQEPALVFAFAGMTHRHRHSRERGNPLFRPTWTPAFAGMTIERFVVMT